MALQSTAVAVIQK